MIDVNLRGVLYGIAAALPVFRRQGHGHLVTTVSTAGPAGQSTCRVTARGWSAGRWPWLAGLPGRRTCRCR
jgi:NAD(P)-dependent dehydrogenase (short-subunit alcohol dehydrogenase family)